MALRVSGFQGVEFRVVLEGSGPGPRVFQVFEKSHMPKPKSWGPRKKSPCNKSSSTSSTFETLNLEP